MAIFGDGLLAVPNYLNTFQYSNGNFKMVQSVRLVMMIASLAIWLTLGFIMVKEVLYQLHFWVLTVWLYAISAVAISSGRQVVEAKMLCKMKREQERGQTNYSRSTESEAGLQLPQEERTDYWRLALIAYSMAVALVFCSPMQYHFSDQKRDVTCNFVKLGHPDDESIYQECRNAFYDNMEYWESMSGWRHPAYLISLYAPPIFLVVEICLNQLVFQLNHIFFQYLFTLFYVLVVGVLQFAGAQEIYVAGFDWSCLRTSTGPCAWGDLGSFFGIWLGLQTLFFGILLALHVAKQKYCCQQSDNHLREYLLEFEDKEA